MKPTRITEAAAQAKLMKWTLDEKNHILAAPNIKVMYFWEADLISITRAYFAHEFEIKRTRADYRADFIQKRAKHQLINSSYKNIPNYFWFVTADLDIDPPDYAGWIKLQDTGNAIEMWVKKEAPRLHNEKILPMKIETIGRICAYRLKDLYVRKYLKPPAA